MKLGGAHSQVPTSAAPTGGPVSTPGSTAKRVSLATLQPLVDERLERIAAFRQNAPADATAAAKREELSGHRAGLGDPLLERRLHARLTRAAVTQVLTDAEGMPYRLADMVAGGGLVLADGRLEIARPNDRAISLGDFFDRGDWSIRMTDAWLDLGDRYGERVASVTGNREIKLLTLLHDGPQLRQGSLDENLAAWFAGHSAAGALDHHLRELGVLGGGNVTPMDAAEDYLARVMPGGSFFELIQRGQIIKREGSVVFVHGGLNDHNIGMVPGASKRIEDPDLWFEKLNAWGKERIEEIANAVMSRGAGAHVPLTLVRYGDAVWDPTAVLNGRHGVALGNSMSVIYPIKRRADGNYRALSDGVRDYLRRGGMDTVVCGHQPFSDLPGPLRGNGNLSMMSDTSRSNDGAGSITTVTSSGVLRVRGITATQLPVSYVAHAKRDSVVGMVTKDGFTVIGRHRKQGETRYVLHKVYDGRKVSEKAVTLAQLRALEPKPATTDVVEEAATHYEMLLDTLKSRVDENGQPRHVLHAVQDVREELVGSLTPVVFCGASGFGQLAEPEEVVERELRAWMKSIDLTKVIFFTGGTDMEGGFERIVHKLALEYGVPLVGFINEGTVPGQIDMVKHLVVAGAYKDWLAPACVAMGIAHESNGFTVFGGGGGTVTKTIAEARRLSLRFALMRKGDVPGDGGASAVACAEQPERGFSTAAELVALLGKP